MSVARAIPGWMLAAALAAVLWSAHAPGRAADPGSASALVNRPAGTDALDGDPVDLGTGLFVREDDDLVVPGTPPIRLRRTYRSNDPRPRAFGIGMSHSYDHFLVGDAAAYGWVAVILADGGRIDFVRVSPGTGQTGAVLEHTSSPTEFYRSRISWNGTGWHLTLQDGQRLTFSACDAKSRCGLIQYRDREGRVLTMTRDSAGDLIGIIASGKDGVRFANDAAHRITRASAGIGGVPTALTYRYDTRGRLIKVEKLAGTLSTSKEYTYDDAHRMLTVKESTFRLTNTYDHSGRVIGQVTSDGQPFTFRYVVDERGHITQTDVSNPDRSLRRVVFNAQGYATRDTYAVGTPREHAVAYEREAGSNRVLTMTVTCASAGRPHKVSAALAARDPVDQVRSRLLERCR